MAYGKIKADAIIYDNSGSDVEKTIASLAADTEGTAIKSTGETNNTKFLRVDGDGSCSWQVPVDTNTQLSTEQVQDIVGAMVTGNTETGIAVTYEDGDGTLDFVVGTLNQDTTGTAAVATEITATANNSTDETVYPTFVDGATGTQGIETDTGLTYNPSTGLLTAVGLTLSGNLTVNGSTTTVNTATLNVEDKNIELGKVSSPSDTTADGGGITLKGATDKEIKWINATDSWTFNQNVTVTTGALTVQGIEGGAATLFLVADEADDNADYWRIQNVAADNTLVFANYTTGGYTTTLKLNPNGALEDSKGNVRSIPSNAQSSAHVATAADAGKAIHISSGGVTINNSVFSAGDAVTIINNSGSDQTITQGSGFTLHNSADASSGNRTLAGRGMATIWFGAANYGYISGAGLS
ncbi:MAG TPA: hypothetical protein DCL76_08550 [Chloroflexi bacterium]|nr:hypothetical protein [Chloroflexota bacterium]|tara:strand:- start:3040 stop:4272 length:1233 start_codon:yes stop_codon:yes gene_type:complete